jgi:putative PIN family toxin of toxin-antitoxin system
MDALHVVLGTNVLVAGLRSRNGASFQLLSRIGPESGFEIHLSVPLVLEYEAVLKQAESVPHLDGEEIDAFLDYLCAVGHHREIFFLWRPQLRDPSDEMVLEVAVEASCDFIITHNLKDFRGVERLGLQAISPGDFLRRLGENT